jgi:translation initiation factor IF-3
MLHKDLGYKMVEQIIESLQDSAKVEQPGKMFGKRMALVVVPK